MEILAHRGLWKKPAEKNSIGSLLAALDSGFGIETDVRDFGGELVVSHDLPNKGALKLEEFFSKAEGKGVREAAIALNIKSDGLDSELARILREYKLKRTFLFDMSIPTLYQFSKKFGPERLCTRISDIEPEPILLEKCSWVWVDCFNKNWHDWDKLLNLNHGLAFVSPELHGRNSAKFWESLGGFQEKRDRLFLCTDLPKDASRYFGAKR